MRKVSPADDADQGAWQPEHELDRVIEMPSGRITGHEAGASLAVESNCDGLSPTMTDEEVHPRRRQRAQV